MIMTRHAEKRIKQRVGAGRGSAHKLAQRALEYGILATDTDGQLRRWMDLECRKQNTANNCRYYVNKLFIFRGQTLITVLDSRVDFEQNLLEYVTNIKAYIRYKEHRLSRKPNPEATEKFTNAMKDLITAHVKKHISGLAYPHNWRFWNVDVYILNKTVVINYTKWDPEKGEHIREYIKKTTGFETTYYYKENQEVDYKEAEYIEEKIKEVILSSMEENDDKPWNIKINVKEGAITVRDVSLKEEALSEITQYFKRIAGYDVVVEKEPEPEVVAIKTNCKGNKKQKRKPNVKRFLTSKNKRWAGAASKSEEQYWDQYLKECIEEYV